MAVAVGLRPRDPIAPRGSPCRGATTQVLGPHARGLAAADRSDADDDADDPAHDALLASRAAAAPQLRGLSQATDIVGRWAQSS